MSSVPWCCLTLLRLQKALPENLRPSTARSLRPVASQGMPSARTASRMRRSCLS